MKVNKLLTQCLIVSLGLHVAALYVFYAHPLLLKPYLTTVLGKNAPLVVIPMDEEDINLSEKNIALTEVFNHLRMWPPQLTPPFDFEKVIPVNALQPKFEPYTEQAKSFIIGNLPEDRGIAEQAAIPVQPLKIAEVPIENPLIQVAPSLEKAPLIYSFALDPRYVEELSHTLSFAPLEWKAPLRPDLHYPPILEELMASKATSPGAPTEIPTRMVGAPVTLLSAKTEHFSSETSLFQEELKTATFGALHAPEHKPLLPKRSTVPELISYGFPGGPSLSEWDEDFFVEVRMTKKEEGGHLFSLAFLPKYDMTPQRMKQTYYFLIDRSNSIDKHRYQTFKRAVSRALQSLREGNAFNVIVFDSKVSKLSEAPLVCSKKTLKQAEEFLENQEHGSFFASTDIYQALKTVVPSDAPSDESSVAILITDGESSLHPEKQRKLIQSWLQQNEGKINLYTACVGQGNNKTFLELLSTFARGKMLYSETHTAFPRKLAKLVLSLRNPIAKDMTLSIVKTTPQSNLKLYPSSSSLPLLFSDQPYELFGTMDELSEFTLLLEGKNKEKLFTIKKTISFANAKSDPKSVNLAWKTYQNFDPYETFLKKGQISAISKLHDQPKHPRR